MSPVARARKTRIAEILRLPTTKAQRAALHEEYYQLVEQMFEEMRDVPPKRAESFALRRLRELAKENVVS